MNRDTQKFNIKPLALALIAIGLSGCAATDKANKNFAEAEKRSEVAYQGTYVKSSAAASASGDPEKEPLANFSRASKNWVNPIPLPKISVNENRANLPEMFKKNVSLTMPGKVSLVEVVSEIQRANGVVFDISQDVYNVGPVGQGKIIGPQGGGGGTDKIVTPVYINDFVYRGSLENALDLVASKANVSWKWTGSSIKLFRFETKTYGIAALAGDTQNNSSVSMQSAPTSGGGSTTANQGVNRTSTLTKWNEIRAYLLSMLSSSGTLAVLESAGVITINDTPAVHALLGKAIKELNSVISKQIYVNVDIYAVNVNSADNVGVDWKLAWSTANSKFGVGYASAGNTGTNGNFNIGLLSGPFAGSGVILNALSTLGRASVMNQFALTTLNGEPTPVSSNRKIGFVESVKSTPSITAGVAPSTEIVQSSVFSGIGLTVTPKVQPDGKILMEYALNLNDVEDLKSFTTGSGANAQTIQLPTTTVKSILQRASLRSGQTLVLSGFKQTVARNNNSGVGSPSNIVLGGKQNASNEEQYLVITITPYLAQDNE